MINVDSIDLRWYWLACKRRWRINLILFGVIISVALIFVYTANPRYTAQTTIILPESNSSMSSALMAQLGGLIGTSGGKSSAEMYLSMLKSKRIGEAIVKKYDLISEYQVKALPVAVSVLQSSTQMQLGKDGIVSLNVESADPILAAKLANEYFIQLNRVSAELSVSGAAQKRKFFEEQLNHSKKQLSNVEASLKALQQNVGVLQLDQQSLASMRALDKIKSELTSKEIEKHSLEKVFTEENPRLKQVSSEIEALRFQLNQLKVSDKDEIVLSSNAAPGLMLDYYRKVRDVKYHEAMFEVMLKQYELAKLDEAKSFGTAQQLDVARTPLEKSFPNKTKIMQVAILMSLLLCIGLSIVLECKDKNR